MRSSKPPALATRWKSFGTGRSTARYRRQVFTALAVAFGTKVRRVEPLAVVAVITWIEGIGSRMLVFRLAIEQRVQNNQVMRGWFAMLAISIYFSAAVLTGALLVSLDTP